MSSFYSALYGLPGAALLGVLGAGWVSQEAQGSCGTAFCMVNTNWGMQGVSNERGARFDLRYEFIDQDQPMSGSRKVGVGEIRQHHDEVRTINRNWLATLDYT